MTYMNRINVTVYCTEPTRVTFIRVSYYSLPGTCLPRTADINQPYYVRRAALYADVASVAEIEIYLLYHAASCT